MIGRISGGNQNWLFAATNRGLWGRNLDTPDTEISIANVGRTSGLAVHPVSHLVYALNSGGQLWEINPSTGVKTVRATLTGSSGWGLDFLASSGTFYATNPSSNIVYKVNRSNWTVGRHYAGLWRPAF